METITLPLRSNPLWGPFLSGPGRRPPPPARACQAAPSSHSSHWILDYETGSTINQSVNQSISHLCLPIAPTHTAALTSGSFAAAARYSASCCGVSAGRRIAPGGEHSRPAAAASPARSKAACCVCVL